MPGQVFLDTKLLVYSRDEASPFYSIERDFQQLPRACWSMLQGYAIRLRRRWTVSRRIKTEGGGINARLLSLRQQFPAIFEKYMPACAAVEYPPKIAYSTLKRGPKRPVPEQGFRCISPC